MQELNETGQPKRIAKFHNGSLGSGEKQTEWTDWAIEQLLTEEIIPFNCTLIEAYESIHVRTDWMLMNLIWPYDSCTRFLLLLLLYLCILFQSFRLRWTVHLIPFGIRIDCETISIELITAFQCATRSICSLIFLRFFFHFAFHVCLFVCF